MHSYSLKCCALPTELTNHSNLAAAWADDGVRFHNFLLGGQTLYQLSYTRNKNFVELSRFEREINGPKPFVLPLHHSSEKYAHATGIEPVTRISPEGLTVLCHRPLGQTCFFYSVHLVRLELTRLTALDPKSSAAPNYAIDVKIGGAYGTWTRELLCDRQKW